MDLQEAINRFITVRETYCNDKTVWNYKNTLRYMVDYFTLEFGVPAEQINVNEIMIDNINNYVLYLRGKIKNYGHPFNTAGGTLSKRSIRTYSIDMRTFFNWLEKYEITSHNEMKKFRMIKSESRSIIPINQDQMKMIDDIYDINKEIGCRNLLMIHLMVDEGMRSSEVINLTLENVNFEDRYIVIRDGKGSKDRIIPISKNVTEYLNRYLKKVKRKSDAYILQTRDGEQLTSNCIKNIFVRLKQKTEIKSLYPHLLRHTFATSFVIAGGNLEILRYYLGHEDINTTQKYLHIATGLQFHKNVYRIDPIFFERNYNL